MKRQSRLLAAAFAVLLFSLSAKAGADTPARSYAVMSLVGNTLQIYTVRPQVGTRVAGESRHELAIADPVFDKAALVAADAAIKRVQPRARAVLMMSEDAGLYAAQNAMFDAPAANQANRDYLIALLKERGVSHLLLVTKQRDNANFKLTNGTTGSGQLEGLGFYIDDTSRLRNAQTYDAASGMLGPFAYIRVRLLDAATLAVVGDMKASKSAIIAPPSASPSAMDIWTGMDSAEKIAHITTLLGDAMDETITSLLAK